MTNAARKYLIYHHNGSWTYVDTYGDRWTISIEDTCTPMGDAYMFSHEDYDGPEDGRCSFSLTLGGAMDDIDEMAELLQETDQ